MNRFHVHLNVADLAASIRFYTELFDAEPTVRKADYAKWMLDNTRVNLAGVADVATSWRTPAGIAIG